MTKIKYTGNKQLTYRSAPSGNEYYLDPGVEFEPINEDIEFFRNIAIRTQNRFEIVPEITPTKKYHYR